MNQQHIPNPKNLPHTNIDRIPQARILRTFFAKHIKEKIAPKKHEVELLIKDHPTVIKAERVTIKAYVYNCYRPENNKNK